MEGTWGQCRALLSLGSHLPLVLGVRAGLGRMQLDVRRAGVSGDSKSIAAGLPIPLLGASGAVARAWECAGLVGQERCQLLGMTPCQQASHQGWLVAGSEPWTWLALGADGGAEVCTGDLGESHQRW